MVAVAERPRLAIAVAVEEEAEEGDETDRANAAV